METNSLIGQPIDRTDGRLKVTGGARYSAEVNLPGLVYGVIISSQVSKGTVVAMDTSAADKAPGVLAVLTPFNMPKLPQQPEPKGGVRPTSRKISLLQDATVHYELQPIGVVVADTLERAMHGVSLVQVKYDEQPPVAGMVTHLEDSFAPKQVGGSHPEATDTAEKDADAMFAGSHTKFAQIYQTPIENHNAMEPHATIAWWTDPQHLTLFDSSQGVFSTRKRVAELFQVPPENVRVVCHYVGGGFGSKGPVWSHTMLAAMCARQVGKPVRIELTRRTVFNNTGSRPHTYQTLTFGAGEDGKLSALRHDSVNNVSDFDDFTESAATTSRMLYASDRIETSHRLVRLNVGTPSYMRAPGEASGMFALESAMDELAYELKMDPIALRLKNYAETDQEEKKPFSSKSLRQCYEQGAKAFGWDKRQASPEPRSVRDGRWLVGYGMASATYPTHRSLCHALARINPDGTALVQAGTQDLGTGTWTVMTQVAAATLGLPLDKVRFELGDTLLPETPVSGGSQTAASAGSAVQAVCRQALAQLVQRAIADEKSPLHGAAEADVIGADGRLSLKADPTKGETYAALLTRTRQPVEVKTEAKPSDEMKKFSTHSFGAQFAEVRVNEDTGEVRVARWVGAFGVGNRLNEKTATSQLKGGIIFGIGMALMEHTVVDDRDAKIVNPNLAEYHVPVNADVPDIDVIFVDEHDDIINPLGVKGAGEIGIVGTPAAIANAVYHATGIRVRELPITPDTLLKA